MKVKDISSEITKLAEDIEKEFFELDRHVKIHPDEKLRFYKLCTHDFAKENFQRIKEIHQCLVKKMQH